MWGDLINKTMKKYFTSDLHLGHRRILEYCNRPFKSMERMNEVLINNINSRAKEEDLVIHVGDFACYGKERGTECNRTNPITYFNQIKANTILVKGNHDINNKVKYMCNGLIVSLGKIGSVTVSHYPTNDLHCPQEFRTKSTQIGYHICGHVHSLWKHYYDKENNKLNINVGIDVWNYQIVSEDELISYICKVKKELGL